MKKFILFLFALFSLSASAEDGHRLWLRSELPNDVVEKIDPTMPDDDGYRINGHTITARTKMGLLYGRYALLRGEQGESHPFYKLRILNHWDNLDGTIERGYAGKSILWNNDLVIDHEKIAAYAEANASIGINGTVLNNVNASPKMLTRTYINKVKEIAGILRPWGIKVYLSVNFGTPKALGETKTADPLDPQVKRWWQKKAKEIYTAIPDFGGFLVKANSEGQPGPFDYGRTHADGANMLADALAPYKGIVIWRSFVYGAKHHGEDRVNQAVSEFAELDGKFRENVILQSKNGPLDFQPREPYAPIFDKMQKTPQMAELQITQEYLGQSWHLVYLAPMWKEFFTFVKPEKLVGIAGVANIGLDKNWCGHHFSQANWYAFGRLAWNPALSSRQIAEEWLKQTFGNEKGIVKSREFASAITSVMLRSREACVDYMMPLGLHHIFKFDHHMGPQPDGYIARYPIEWCPVYYHRANGDSIGVDRTHTGSNATGQYPEPYCSLYDDINTCPERYLLWFHRVPWTRRMNSGRTLWEEMQWRYNQGVSEVEDFIHIWQEARPEIDEQRWREVNDRLQRQLKDAKEWRDVCLGYFGKLQEKK
ncbi:alpha-glucuronidase [Prevotella communis]|uniref:Alpha-glucuronidase n=1 Tax=Prevotella communis TaxID=2913614 RepID=A0A1H0D2P4_9BACT|nr:alpha-glucuronidase [Prevotella communis]UKK62437.1 alpha-glucuronidase [Prevotella communis]UKK65262.1 alpha-glucuronidase [Prevotella communis]SDN64423.1 alpha-glucuronidase [Prevotella communis]